MTEDQSPKASVTTLESLPVINHEAPEKPFERFIDKAEVARRMGMQPRTVDHWMSRKIIPYYRIAHSVLFKWSEVEAFLAEHNRVCPETDPK